MVVIVVVVVVAGAGGGGAGGGGGLLLVLWLLLGVVIVVVVVCRVGHCSYWEGWMDGWALGRWPLSEQELPGHDGTNGTVLRFFALLYLYLPIEDWGKMSSTSGKKPCAIANGQLRPLVVCIYYYLPTYLSRQI